MNPDTPGAVPSDDFPFLGPAISPRRREAGSPLRDSGELAAPFVGGGYDRPTEDAASHEVEPAVPSSLEDTGDGGPLTEPPSASEHGGYAEGVAAEDEALESFPGADWPSDDFPWLSPSQVEPEEEEATEPWRPTAGVDDLVAEPQGYGIDPEADVQHLSWIGEPVSAGEAQPREPEPYPVASDDEVADMMDVGAFAPDAAEEERAGFEVDSEPAEDSWTRAEGWREEARGEAEPETAAAAEEGLGFQEALEAPAPVAQPVGAPTEDRWQEDVGFRVEEEPQGEAAGDRQPGDREAVEATPLPVGEWESPAAATEAVEEEKVPEEVEEVMATAEGTEADPLAEVADRLERIAQALRSGQALQAVEQGDPLQLLITGYALGYSQARRGGR